MFMFQRAFQAGRFSSMTAQSTAMAVFRYSTVAGLLIYAIASHSRRQRKHPFAPMVSLARTPYFLPDATLLMALTLA